MYLRYRPVNSAWRLQPHCPRRAARLVSGESPRPYKEDRVSMTVNIGSTANIGTGTGVPKWVRALLFAAALVETIGGLTGLTLFSDFHEYESTAAQWAIFANLAIAPVFAIPALYFIAEGNLRYGILALAAVAMAALALDTLPTIFVQGMASFGEGVMPFYLFVRMLVLPALCVWAAWLAWRNERLMLAGILVSLPSIASIVDLLAFAAGLVVYS